MNKNDRQQLLSTDVDENNQSNDDADIIRDEKSHAIHATKRNKKSTDKLTAMDAKQNSPKRKRFSPTQKGLGVVMRIDDKSVASSIKSNVHPNDGSGCSESRATGGVPKNSNIDTYFDREHVCVESENEDEADSMENCTITKIDTRHRNYKFNFKLSQYEKMEQFYLDLWTKNTKYIIFQKEISETGYKHIQAYAEFKSAVNFQTAKNKLGVSYVQPVEKCEKRSAMLYCSKMETRMVGTEPKQIGIPNGSTAEISAKEWTEYRYKYCYRGCGEDERDYGNMYDRHFYITSCFCGSAADMTSFHKQCCFFYNQYYCYDCLKDRYLGGDKIVACGFKSE